MLFRSPFIETTHGNLRMTAPLTAITASVVGVIFNLALFFAYHVFWPAGLGTKLDWPSIILAVTAAVAIFKFKVNVIPVILGGGLLGMGWKLLA